MDDSRPHKLSSRRLAYAFAREMGVLIVKDEANTQLYYRSGEGLPPADQFKALLEARRLAARDVTPKGLPPSEFEALLSQTYAQGDLSETIESAMDQPDDLMSLADGLPSTSDLLDSDDDAPVIRLINGIMQEAIRTRASDVHIEPFESRLAVRFRIDGTLRDMLSLSPRLASVLVSRVKVMSKLDIAKKRIPQDGRFSLNLGQKAIDVRVSTLPSQYGERVVMRILEKDSMRLSMSDLGMRDEMLEVYDNGLRRPNGILLVTGPTGSGKTTTLYASLSQLNDGSRNILTVEDPVEYALDGINQTQVNNKVGMSFAAGLRAILRQDPDVVMVGEIRDPETTEIAVQAALTGHLVLSTVHTNSAIAAIARLRDMGVEPFLLASTITGIVAQRLVRRLCPHCKEETELSDLTRKELGLKKNHPPVYKAVGCGHCNGIGYEGRLGLYEYVEMDDTLREMIHAGASDTQMSRHAFRSSETLLQSGVSHILAGRTTAEEVLRVCRATPLEDG